MADMSLEGRIAMVTGAGRGIGEAIAGVLATAGAAVAVCDRDGDSAAAAAARLARGMGVQMDVSDSAAVRSAVARISAELGPIDILVNNAGWDKVEPFVNSTEATWDRIIAINL